MLTSQQDGLHARISRALRAGNRSESGSSTHGQSYRTQFSRSRVVRWCLAFVTLATASISLSETTHAQAPYRIWGTGGQGVFLRIDGPSFSSRKAAGPNDGQTDFTVICQTTGDNYGGSTIWDYIEYRGNRGYINDYFVYTGYSGFDPRLPRCGAAPSDPHPVAGVFSIARDRNGASNVGRPTNAVHRWGSGNVQDFNGGSWGWNIVMQSDSNMSIGYVVRHGFWQWYRANNNQGLTSLGYPTSEEYAHAGGSRQNFQKAMLQWHSSRGVTRVAYPPVKPAPTPTTSYLEPIAEYQGIVHSAAQAIANARSALGLTEWDSPIKYCLKFTWWAYTNGKTVTGKGYQDAVQMIYGDRTRSAVPGIIRTGTPPAGAVVLYDSSTSSSVGHAAISIGGGRVISNSVNGKIGEVDLNYFSNYYGYIPFSG
jgi:hypothetical protein